MAKKGVFPYFAEGLQELSANADWDGESGFVKFTSGTDVDLTFDTDDYTGSSSIESGAAIFVQNSSSATNSVIITGGQFDDASGVTASVGPGESVTIMFHEDYGFVFLGGAEIDLGT